jgi:DNA-binding IclR family transcriptional regulator
VSRQQDEGGNAEGATSQTVTRALTLLDLVATSEKALSATQLAAQSGLARTTALRLLTTLTTTGYLDYVPGSGFVLGFKATRMSRVGAAEEALARRARPWLERLLRRVEETVGLSVPIAGSLVELVQLDPPRPIRQMSYTHESFPLHCTSNGKLLLARLDEGELESYLASPLERRTPRTIVDPGPLRVELARIRSLGYGICHEELYEDINGVSGTILGESGRPVAFVSVSGPSFRLTMDRIHRIAPDVLASCEEIRQRLGIGC